MAWTAPTTRSTSDLITASIWNTDLVDNLSYLKSQVNAQIQVSAGAMQPCVTQGACLNVARIYAVGFVSAWKQTSDRVSCPLTHELSACSVVFSCERSRPEDYHLG